MGDSEGVKKVDKKEIEFEYERVRSLLSDQVAGF